MAENDQLASHQKASYETVKSIAITLLFLICGWLYNAQQRTEERIYQLSATALTDQKGQQMEQRISASIETRFADLSSRLDLLLRLVQQGNNSEKR